jgi:hypothetical protein
LLKETFQILNITPQEKIRKQKRRREELTRRIVERTSFKGNQERWYSEIMELRERQ